MITWDQFKMYSLDQKINTLYRDGSFIVGIRYYGFKVNLYLLGQFYVEVFYDHKRDRIEKVTLLDLHHSRMKFYYDQIKLPQEISQ